MTTITAFISLLCPTVSVTKDFLSENRLSVQLWLKHFQPPPSCLRASLWEDPPSQKLANRKPEADALCESWLHSLEQGTGRSSPFIYELYFIILDLASRIYYYNDGQVQN